MIGFTEDELTLMMIYNPGTKDRLIQELATMQKALTGRDRNLRKWTKGALKKLHLFLVALSQRCQGRSSGRLKEPYETMNAADRQKGARIMMELTYKQNGDYQLPEIQLETREERPLSKYGRMRRAYLQENNSLLYNHLTLTGKLFPHLWEIQDTATIRVEQLMVQLMQQNPAPDKKTQQMAWVQHMNMLKAQAEETVIAELITA